MDKLTNCCIAIIVGFSILLILGVVDCIVKGIKDRRKGKIKSIFTYLKEEW